MFGSFHVCEGLFRGARGLHDPDVRVLVVAGVVCVSDPFTVGRPVWVEVRRRAIDEGLAATAIEIDDFYDRIAVGKGQSRCIRRPCGTYFIPRFRGDRPTLSLTRCLSISARGR